MSPGNSRIHVLLAVLAAGCTAADSATPGSVVLRDSAGVAIVENPALSLAPQLEWTLAAAPRLEIGTVDGSPAHQLFRVADALRFQDGSVAVLDRGSSEVRLFSGDGAHLATWGGRGEGPGEFASPAAIFPWPADSVAVWDAQLRRITLFGPGGETGRSFAIPSANEIELPLFGDRLPNGNLIVSAVTFSMDGVPRQGLQRNPLSVAVVSPAGVLIGELGQHAGDEMYVAVGDGSISVMRLPFTRSSIVAPAGEHVLIGDNARFELRYFSEDGTLARIARVAESPYLVTRADQDAELQKRLDRADEADHPGVRQLFEEAPMPDTLPSFSSIVEDALGNHWVEVYRTPSDSGPAVWVVLDTDGELMGTVELPEGLDVYEIGSDYVLGHAVDDLEVEHIQVWPLLRGRR